ncbi:MAG: glycosyltransferase family 4 protein [Bacteroidia bacterium]
MQNNIKLLWLSPNLNHYKARFLDYLASGDGIKLTVISGSGRIGKGDKSLNKPRQFREIRLAASKSKFGISREVRKTLKSNFNDFDWVLIPREKKNLLLILYAAFLRIKARSKGQNIRLVSYNHPMLRSSGGKSTLIDKALTRIFYNIYDRIIFYSEASRNECVTNGIISANKAYWANNTIDTIEVDKHYTFSYPNPSNPTLLFIGRLIPSKKIDTCLEYYFSLKKELSKEEKILKLIIIGDGPESHFVKEAISKDSSIEWYGAIIDEAKISKLMQRATFVFVPGLSGLSINHAFSYGRPYITFAGLKHGPEINYLKNNVNGLLLEPSLNDNIIKLRALLITTDKKLFNNACSTGKELSIANWKHQFTSSLN